MGKKWNKPNHKERTDHEPGRQGKTDQETSRTRHDNAGNKTGYNAGQTQTQVATQVTNRKQRR